MPSPKIICNTIMALAACTSSFALAHGDEVHTPQTAPHGGQVVVAGAYHLELVVSKDSKEPKDNPVVVFVTDQSGSKVTSAGATGSVTLLTGKTKTTAVLSADGENRLKGTAVYASTPDMKAIIAVSLAGKPPVQARFTPLAAPIANQAGNTK